MSTMTIQMSAMAAARSTMRADVAQLSVQAATQNATVSALRSALLAAATAAPSRPSRPNGGSDRRQRVEAYGADLAIKAPRGTVTIHSDSCAVSDLCTATAFAENLKAELSNIV